MSILQQISIMEGKNKVKIEEQAHSFIPPTLFSSSSLFPKPKSHSANPNPGLSLNLNTHTQSDLTNAIICFNPYCTLPYSRIFQPVHSHKNVEACHKWMISYDSLGKLVTKKSSSNKQKNDIFELSLGKSQFQDNINFWKFTQKVDWTKYLLDFKNMFMKKIEQQFNQMLLSIRLKIQSLKSQEMIANLQDLHNSIKQKSKNEVQLRKFIQYIVSQYLNPLSNKSIVIKCPGSQDIQSASLSSITSTIQQKIFIERDQGTSVSVVQEENHQEFRRFMSDQNGAFNKLQQVSSMCGTKCTDFLVKTKIISLKCPFCEHAQKQKISVKQIQKQLKVLKKQLSMQVLEHCFQCHYSLLYSKYEQKKPTRQKNSFSNSYSSSRISKQINFAKAIETLKQTPYSQLQIIDRESGLANEPNRSRYGNQKPFKLQILSRNNRAMARMQYILTPDRKSTELMINNLIIYVCFVEKLIGLGNVYVQTNCKDVKLNFDKLMVFNTLMPSQTSRQSRFYGPRQNIEKIQEKQAQQSLNKQDGQIESNNQIGVKREDHYQEVNDANQNPPYHYRYGDLQLKNRSQNVQNEDGYDESQDEQNSSSSQSSEQSQNKNNENNCNLNKYQNQKQQNQELENSQSKTIKKQKQKAGQAQNPSENKKQQYILVKIQQNV